MYKYIKEIYLILTLVKVTELYTGFMALLEKVR